MVEEDLLPTRDQLTHDGWSGRDQELQADFVDPCIVAETLRERQCGLRGVEVERAR